MAHAQICPICEGVGKLRCFNGVRVTGIEINGEKEEQCHGCGGKGWVEVGESSCPTIPQYYPQPYQPYSPGYWPWPITVTYTTGSTPTDNFNKAI